MSARICADICSLLQCPIFSKSKMSAKVRMKKNKVRILRKLLRMFAGLLAHMEKCPQKSTGFDKGTDICGFVADICRHTPTSAKIYANVRGSPHMSAAYARPVADIEGTVSMLVKISADDILKYFSYFSLKTGFDIPCKLHEMSKV